MVFGFLAWRYYDDDGPEKSLVRAVAASILIMIAFLGVIAPSLRPLFPSAMIARVMPRRRLRLPHRRGGRLPRAEPRVPGRHLDPAHRRRRRRRRAAPRARAASPWSRRARSAPSCSAPKRSACAMRSPGRGRGHQHQQRPSRCRSRSTGPGSSCERERPSADRQCRRIRCSGVRSPTLRLGSWASRGRRASRPARPCGRRSAGWRSEPQRRSWRSPSRWSSSTRWRVAHHRALPRWFVAVFESITDFGKSGWFLWPDRAPARRHCGRCVAARSGAPPIWC